MYKTKILIFAQLECVYFNKMSSELVPNFILDNTLFYLFACYYALSFFVFIFILLNRFK